MYRNGKHVSELYGVHTGRPIIVVGGGPSLPDTLRSLPRTGNEVIVFANGHGFRVGLEPDYIVCKDHQHTATRALMEDGLREHGKYPILTPHYWADYRMGRWPTQGNSGQLAIAAAALMGGYPIIPIGIDCYQGPTYFHEDDPLNVSRGRHDGAWQSTMTRMMLRLDGAVIRPAGGFLTKIFKRYDPREKLPLTRIPTVFDHYADLETRDLRLVEPPGWIVKADAVDREKMVRLGRATVDII